MPGVARMVPEAECHGRLRLPHPSTFYEALWLKSVKPRLYGDADCRSQYIFRFGVVQFRVDFYLPELKLAIEIDGKSHVPPRKRERDEWRTRCLHEKMGVTVRRFSHEEIEALASAN